MESLKILFVVSKRSCVVFVVFNNGVELVHAYSMLRIILLKEAICVFQNAGVKESPTPVQSVCRNERSDNSAFQAVLNQQRRLAIICFETGSVFHHYTLNCVSSQ